MMYTFTFFPSSVNDFFTRNLLTIGEKTTRKFYCSILDLVGDLKSFFNFPRIFRKKLE